nr:hypothetical protein Iba_chr03fCG2560 [Ipomoea batatas]
MLVTVSIGATRCHSPTTRTKNIRSKHCHVDPNASAGNREDIDLDSTMNIGDLYVLRSVSQRQRRDAVTSPKTSFDATYPPLCRRREAAVTSFTQQAKKAAIGFSIDAALHAAFWMMKVRSSLHITPRRCSQAIVVNGVDTGDPPSPPSSHLLSANNKEREKKRHEEENKSAGINGTTAPPAGVSSANKPGPPRRRRPFLLQRQRLRHP